MPRSQWEVLLRRTDSPLAPSLPPRAVLAVHARGTHGREEEEEEDVAREGEMAAENKPEGKRNITGFI